MNDILDKLADDIAKSTAETCARIAEMHRIPLTEHNFQDGYNAAVRDIAAKNRELRP